MARFGGMLQMPPVQRAHDRPDIRLEERANLLFARLLRPVHPAGLATTTSQSDPPPVRIYHISTVIPPLTSAYI